MAGKLHFSLVAPERQLFSAEGGQGDAPGAEGAFCERVDAPGVQADFAVLYGHAPFMTALKAGSVTVRDGSATRVFAIDGGFADVTPARLIILAEQARKV